MAAVGALLATIAVGTAGCSGETVVAVTPSVSASKPVATSASPTRPVVPVPRVVTPAHLARSVPVRLQIAAIGVDSDLMALGLKKDKTLEVPPRGFPAGWYTGMATPGELGTAIIVGHVDWNGPGVFYRLHSLKPGDKVTVTRKDGSAPVFRVTRVARFPKNSFPTKLVYGFVGHSALRLITCGGSFNRATGHYEDNIVAFADLVAPAR
jgi:Sortase domain